MELNPPFPRCASITLADNKAVGVASIANIRAGKRTQSREVLLMRQLTIHRTLRSTGFVLALSLSGMAAAQGRHDTTQPTVPVATAALQSPPAVAADKRTRNPLDAKLHAQLRTALDARAQGVAWSTASGLPSTLRRGDEVLIEVRFAAGQKLDDAQGVLLRHGATLRNTLSPALHEVWMPIDRLRELAGDASVVRISPARLARRLATISQGVDAGNADYWQKFNPSYTGTGVTIAMIDGYDNSKISGLQGSGDWPPTARLTCYDVKDIAMDPPYAASSCTSGGFGSAGVRHGDLTMEIVYDVAPGATYRAYDTVTVGDWYNSILDAANVNSSGASLGAVRANVISVSLAAPLDGIGDGTALPGSIAEAAGYARSRGILVVNAAGNERENHWGGQYVAGSGSDSFNHLWSGSDTHNRFINASNQPACIPDGNEINVELFWNNWAASVTHLNEVYLYQLGATSSAWFAVANSDCTTFGQGTCVTPQALIQYETSGGGSAGCAAGSAIYAIAVLRETTQVFQDNLEVFASVANTGLPLQYSVAASSLDFPADSPNVLSVAAIDVANATTNPQEPFSSEGPVLAAGGDIPNSSPATDTNMKPDLASFDHVTTVTNGVSAFNGTSAAAPYAAGMAALFMQRFGVQTSATNLTDTIVTPLRTIANTGTNDLGTVGKDYQYGYGRLRFQKDAALAFIQQPTNTLVNVAITPAIKVGIYDTEVKLDLYTLFNTLTLAIANDPDGGAAVLSGGGSGNLVLGVATYNVTKINLGGVGYTLKASASAATTPPINLMITSNAFNITTGAATKLAMLEQPLAVVAGHAINPAVKIGVEDSNGNIVNTDNTTNVTLVRTSCNGVVPVGGGPVTATNGVALFPNLTLLTAGSATLSATAPGRSPATSMAFTVSVNPDYVFRSGFETCVP